MARSSRREPFERASPEKGELQREARVRVLQIRARQLGDATQPLPHRVPVQVQIARDSVEAAVETQVRVEGADKVGVLLTVGERAEGPVGELADVALGSAEHEAVRAEVLEHRYAAVPAQRAAEDDGLLGLKKGKVRARRAPLRTADPRRETVVAVGPRDTRAERLSVGAGVDRPRELAQRGDDARARTDHARVWHELGDRYTQARDRRRVP